MSTFLFVFFLGQHWTRFVEEVKKQCADMDAQWDERQKTRAEETEAISKVRNVKAVGKGRSVHCQ